MKKCGDALRHNVQAICDTSAEDNSCMILNDQASMNEEPAVTAALPTSRSSSPVSLGDLMLKYLAEDQTMESFFDGLLGSDPEDDAEKTRREENPDNDAFVNHQPLAPFEAEAEFNHGERLVDPTTMSLQTRANEPFPLVLHGLLSDLEKSGMENIASWRPHGRAFKVHDKDAFEMNIIQWYFNQTKMASFLRQLQAYGFVRMKHGPDKGAYYHPNFLRDRVDLCCDIARQPRRAKRTPSQARFLGLEPDFYELPPVVRTSMPVDGRKTGVKVSGELFHFVNKPTERELTVSTLQQQMQCSEFDKVPSDVFPQIAQRPCKTDFASTLFQGGIVSEAPTVAAEPTVTMDLAYGSSSTLPQDQVATKNQSGNATFTTVISNYGTPYFVPKSAVPSPTLTTNNGTSNHAPLCRPTIPITLDIIPVALSGQQVSEYQVGRPLPTQESNDLEPIPPHRPLFYVPVTFREFRTQNSR